MMLTTPKDAPQHASEGASALSTILARLTFIGLIIGMIAWMLGLVGFAVFIWQQVTL